MTLIELPMGSKTKSPVYFPGNAEEDRKMNFKICGPCC